MGYGKNRGTLTDREKLTAETIQRQKKNPLWKILNLNDHRICRRQEGTGGDVDLEVMNVSFPEALLISLYLLGVLRAHNKTIPKTIRRHEPSKGKREENERRQERFPGGCGQ